MSTGPMLHHRQGRGFLDRKSWFDDTKYDWKVVENIHAELGQMLVTTDNVEIVEYASEKEHRMNVR